MQIPNTEVPFPMNLSHSKMDKLSSQFYVIDNKLYKSVDVNFQFNIGNFNTYETLRCSKGTLVFLKDHLARMEDGIHKLQAGTIFSEADAMENINLFMKHNQLFEGNIKFLCKLEAKKIRFALFGIQHTYPSADMYINGISLKKLSIERPDPQIKQIHIAYTIREKHLSLGNTEVFESLLVDHNGCITECTRSNFFLIRGDCIFSAPEDQILPGITRKYVMKIAGEKGYPVKHKKISINELSQYKAAFICGTSPKILPVRNIDEIDFNPNNPILNLLMQEYNELLDKHIHTQQFQRIYNT